MKVSSLFPSKYVAAADLPSTGTVVTVDKLTIEEMRNHDNEKETKPVLWFVKATKGLVLNRTNGLIIAGLYGDETDDWRGKRIQLYPTKVRAFGKMQDAIRVREQRFEPPSNVPPVEAPEIDEPDDVLDYEESDFLTVDASTGEIMQGIATTSRSAQPAQPEAPLDGDVVFGKNAPDPATVAVGELTGQKLGVILDWGMAHGQMNKEEARTLWDSIRANGLDGPATLAVFVRTILTPAA